MCSAGTWHLPGPSISFCKSDMSHAALSLPWWGYRAHVPAPKAPGGEIKPKRGGLEQRKGYCRAGLRLPPPQRLNPPRSFRKAFFKASWGLQVSVPSSRSGLRLVAGEVTGPLMWSALRSQEVWGPRSQDHQEINFFHLVGVSGIWKTSGKTREVLFFWALQR